MRPSYLHKLEQVLTTQVSLPAGKLCLQQWHFSDLFSIDLNNEIKLTKHDSDT